MQKSLANRLAIAVVILALLPTIGIFVWGLGKAIAAPEFNGLHFFYQYKK
ncbi:MAG TPA: hypothetical protein VLH19_05415 [Patescibacteria group bacterium]|nr:hypothetical protein [Patescibacteria group bacterium]